MAEEEMSIRMDVCGYRSDRKNTRNTLILTGWRNDGSVGNNDDWFLIVGLQLLQNLVSGLLESAERSVEDSHEEVLSGCFVSVFVINVLGTGDKNDAELLFQFHVFKLDLMESLGDLLLEFSRLGTVFLDDLFSSIEHVCLSTGLGTKFHLELKMAKP